MHCLKQGTNDTGNLVRAPRPFKALSSTAPQSLVTGQEETGSLVPMLLQLSVLELFCATIGKLEGKIVSVGRAK